MQRTVDAPWVEVQERTVAPYSTMDVTVRAHTHWGGGAAARAQLHSPQAVPSAPRKPRVYMQHVQRYYICILLALHIVPVHQLEL